MKDYESEIKEAVARLNSLLARAERQGIYAEIVQVPAKGKADIHFENVGYRLELVGIRKSS